MIETKALERKFVIKVKGKDITIDDPNPKFTLKSVRCPDCKKRWNDMYELTDMEEIE